MDKFLVEVYVPVLDRKYEMFLPAGSKVYHVIKTMCRFLDTVKEEYHFSSMSCVLANRQNGVVYDCNMTIFETGIKNGSKLLLM